MAKEAKKRDYSNVDAKTGLGTLTVKVDDKRSTKVNGIASTAESFKNLVNSADASVLGSLFSIYTRGVESATRVSYKSKHNTLVPLGAGKKIDLIAFAESKGTAKVVAMINNRFDTLDMLSTSEDDSKKTAEQIEKEKTALRKREAGWYNTADALVAAGKATMQNGRLTAA